MDNSEFLYYWLVGLNRGNRHTDVRTAGPMVIGDGPNRTAISGVLGRYLVDWFPERGAMRSYGKWQVALLFNGDCRAEGEDASAGTCVRGWVTGKLPLIAIQTVAPLP